jgi:hypothetical protein
MKQNRITDDQIEKVWALHEEDFTRGEIATQLSLPWKTVDYWVKKHSGRVVKLVDTRNLKFRAFGRTGSIPVPPTSHAQYAYLLGSYLGNGYLNQQGPYTWKLRICNNVKYEGIKNRVFESMLLMGLKPNITTRDNMYTVYCHGKRLEQWFPHGVGAKNTYQITLTTWQRSIVQEHAAEFLCGLYHTDGSRYLHSQTYVMYNFTNKSRDIIDMFCSTCDILKVGYRLNTKKFVDSNGNVTNGWAVVVSRRGNVSILESILGPKT